MLYGLILKKEIFNNNFLGIRLFYGYIFDNKFFSKNIILRLDDVSIIDIKKYKNLKELYKVLKNEFHFDINDNYLDKVEIYKPVNLNLNNLKVKKINTNLFKKYKTK
ncbi:MAG: hypothetical protein LBT66_05830 [Methanobrevibacter sp.]|jgi:hypothetical protein|nr:hypothetical protein [Candidatus Methanovirga meridionalis]